MAGPVNSPSSSHPLGDFNELFVRVRPQMAALDRFMRHQVDCFEPEIRDMAAYCLDTTGKRLRPTMVFISGWQGDGVVSDDLVRAAGVVEMVHLATLVHDDIMDRADLRRNRRTAAREFGPDAAVLLGDALFSQALHVASQFPTTEVCRMVSGIDPKSLFGRNHANSPPARYQHFTGGIPSDDRPENRGAFPRLLFSGGEVFPAMRKVLRRPRINLGTTLGIAYQIYDDLADFVGEEDRIGKTLGNRSGHGKTDPALDVFAGAGFSGRTARHYRVGVAGWTAAWPGRQPPAHDGIGHSWQSGNCD